MKINFNFFQFKKQLIPRSIDVYKSIEHSLMSDKKYLTHLMNEGYVIMPFLKKTKLN